MDYRRTAAGDIRMVYIHTGSQRDNLILINQPEYSVDSC